MLNNISKVIRRIAGVMTSKMLGVFGRPVDLILLRCLKYWHPYINEIDRLGNAIFIFEKISAKMQFEAIKVTGTGVLQIYYAGEVYIIACGVLADGALKENYKNWRLLKNSEFKQLVDYEMLAIPENGFVYYKLDRLYEITDYVEGKDYILSNLKCDSEEYPVKYINTQLSIEKIKKYCNLDISHLLEDQYLSEESVCIGPMHGDLTKNNILKNSVGQYVMIDLDRFQMQGPQFIDALHFNIEQISEREKISWFKIIAKPLDSTSEAAMTVSEGCLFLYFLFRVNAEIRDNVLPLPAYLNYIEQYLKK